MVGVIVDDMSKAAEFYRQLGVAVPDDAAENVHVEVPMGGLRFFLNTRASNERWDPAARSPEGRYKIVLEFFLESGAAVRAKHEELVALGYESHLPPYDVSGDMTFALINDPDGNPVLLSGSRRSDPDH
jgi:hypothetical protein